MTHFLNLLIGLLKVIVFILGLAINFCIFGIEFVLWLAIRFLSFGKLNYNGLIISDWFGDQVLALLKFLINLQR